MRDECIHFTIMCVLFVYVYTITQWSQTQITNGQYIFTSKVSGHFDFFTHFNTKSKINKFKIKIFEKIKIH